MGSGQVVDLLPGQTAHLEFDLTPGIPGRCFIRCEGVEDYSGWKSRGSTTAWTPVSADGLLSQECSATPTWLQVEDGAGRRYQFYASSEDGLEQVIQLERGDCVYTGTLRDPAGEPASGIWITASPAEHNPDSVNVSVMTDDGGRFELAGLEARDYELRFEDREERNRGWVKRWESLRFDPTSRSLS